jgi:hypothetical protein
MPSLFDQGARRRTEKLESCPFPLHHRNLTEISDMLEESWDWEPILYAYLEPL